MASIRKRRISRGKIQSTCTAELSFVQLGLPQMEGWVEPLDWWNPKPGCAIWCLAMKCSFSCAVFSTEELDPLFGLDSHWKRALINVREGPGPGKDTVHPSFGWVTPGVGAVGCGSSWTVMCVIEEQGMVRPSNLEGFGLCPRLPQ